MVKHFRLDGHHVIECSLEEWSVWFSSAINDGSRTVGDDLIAGYRVSTAFIGLNHSASDEHRYIFETAVFDEHGEVGVMDKYAKWNEAREGHEAICASMRTLEAESIEILRGMLNMVRLGLNHQDKEE
jgi:plasmid stability protein